MSEVPGLGWRVSLSIIVGIAWLIFLIIWFFFIASGFTLYQNIAVLIVSLVVVGVVEGLAWVPMWWQPETPGFGRTISVNIVLGAIVSVFIVFWLFFFAQGYTFYENIAIIVIPLTIWGVVQSVTRRRWLKAEPSVSGAGFALGTFVNIAWAAFLFWWFYYQADAYDFLENAVVFIVSAIIMGSLQGIAHAPWRTVSKQPGLRPRVALSAVLGIGWVVFALLWLVFFAPGFSFIQNIAIILVSLLVIAAILGAAWAPWAMKHGGSSSKK